jgi:hypothetical protein
MTRKGSRGQRGIYAQILDMTLTVLSLAKGTGPSYVLIRAVEAVRPATVALAARHNLAPYCGLERLRP